MKITVLVDNISTQGLPVEHGLSLHVRLNDGCAFLFDVGQSPLFADNASRLNIPLDDVQFAILSHGHYDHGGGLRHLHQLLPTLPLYLHGESLRPHYSKRPDGIHYIGIKPSFTDEMSTTCRWCVGEMPLHPGLTLFDSVEGNICLPPGNATLFADEAGSPDTFPDEQNLLIEEGENRVLIAGCAHAGIVNIINKAESICGKPLTHVIGGFHLMKMGLSSAQEERFLSSLTDELMRRKAIYYTMHCTGTEAYLKLKAIMGDSLHYVSTGEQVVIL